ncbi:FAD-binding domain-containing protein [Hypoxylon rubiginosum]|uniref:FAD-binding domain-containing protein n=1 Tax=Hypoxylon rubiginosum TaxID=110542 RepID=A0ACB9Z2E5_9PEZI|nr:FAD-binding domain-containing protein [Hypoxylon rubiginosum]
MDRNFLPFLDSIGLSSSHSETLGTLLHDARNNGSDPAAILSVACQVARQSLGTDQVNSAPLNQTLVDENWSLSCVAEPYCIFLPRNADDVAKAIKIISYFQVRFAIRSGGHSPNPGWSSVGPQGILLDLQNLNDVSLSGDKRVASTGPGARWGSVVAELGAQNATVVAARHPHVGVGGLILGGGYHHTSSAFGLVADNVKNFEIVLSNGTIANVNLEENSDLFWALKGGGPNFGVVTRYDLHTIPVHEIWYQLAVYPPESASTILDIFAEWQMNEGSEDLRANLVLSMGLDAHLLALIYSAPAPANQTPSAFAPFSVLEPLQVITPAKSGTYATFDQDLAPFIDLSPARHDYRGVSSKVDAQLYKDVYNFWLKRAQGAREAVGANQTFVLQHVPSNIAAQGDAKGGNPLGIPHETHQWWTTLVDWAEEKDDEVARSVVIDTVDQWEKLGRERGLYLPFLYMNDAAREQNPIVRYGEENVKRLKEVSLKYDPSQLFQTLQNGGFQLSSALQLGT